MKFSISAFSLFALTGSSLLAVGVNGQETSEGGIVQAINDTITNVTSGGSIVQAINDTITNVVDAVMDSPVGDFIGCTADGVTLLTANPDLAAAEQAYYASTKYSWSSDEKNAAGQYTFDDTSTVSVGLAELAAYEAACKAVDDTVWYSEPASSVMCMLAGSMSTVNYDNGYGVCYPNTDPCANYATVYVNTLQDFYTFLKDSALECTAEMGTVPAGTTMAPVAAAVDVSPAPVAAAVDVSPAPVATPAEEEPAMEEPAMEEPAMEEPAAMEEAPADSGATGVSLSLAAAVASLAAAAAAV